MPKHILSWTDSRLVTIDLEDDRRVVLVFDTAQQAATVGRTIAQQAARDVQVAEIDAPDDGISAAVDVLLGISDTDAELVTAFPGDELFDLLVAQLG